MLGALDRGAVSKRRALRIFHGVQDEVLLGAMLIFYALDRRGVALLPMGALDGGAVSKRSALGFFHERLWWFCTRIAAGLCARKCW